MNNKIKGETKIKIKQYSSLILLSIINGIFIGLFQVTIKYIFEAINKIYESSIETVIPLLIYSGLCIFFIFCFYIIIWFIIPWFKKGTNVLSRYLLNEKVKFYEYPILIVGFALSLFAGLPVGAVEVCEAVGLGLSSEFYKRTEIKVKDSKDIIIAASFGAAFLSPLAGFSYGLESRKWKVNFCYIIKLTLTIAITIGVCYLTLKLFNLENNFTPRLDSIETFSWKSLLIYGLMGVIIAVAAFILNLSTIKIKKSIEEGKKPQNIKTILTVIVLITALVCTFIGLKYQWYAFSLAGYDGSRIIMNYDKFGSGGLLIGTVLLWIFYLLLLPHTKLFGGKIVPVLTVGGLIGLCCVWNGKINNMLQPDEFLMMISVGMFALYGVVYKKPITAICLALTFSRWSVIPYQFLPLILAIAPGYILVVITKLPSWNECIGIPDSLDDFND